MHDGPLPGRPDHLSERVVDAVLPTGATVLEMIQDVPIYP